MSGGYNDYFKNKIASLRLILILIIFPILSTFTYGAITYLSSCQSINSPGEYVLSNDITGSGFSCFSISSSNVILDCKGYGITISTGSNGVIRTSNTNNVAIRNCNIFRAIGSPPTIPIYGDKLKNFTVENCNVYPGYIQKGITVFNSFNVTIRNNFCRGNSSEQTDGCIALSGIEYGLITNNTLITEKYSERAISAGSSIDLNVSNNNIVSLGTNDAYGIFFAGRVNNSIVSNNFINNSKGHGDGVFLQAGKNNSVFNNTIYSKAMLGSIRVQSGESDTYIFNNTIYAKRNGLAVVHGAYDNHFIDNLVVLINPINIPYGIFTEFWNPGNTPYNNTFERNKFLYNEKTEFYLRNPLGLNGSIILKDQPIQNYSIRNYTVTVENTTSGIISFMEPISGEGKSFSCDVSIGGNHAFINPIKPELNKKAKITFYNVPVITNPVLYKDNSPCSSCVLQTGLSGNVIFTAPGAGHYTIKSSSSVCGNGIKEFGEECDDGNNNPNDGCSLICTYERFCDTPFLDIGLRIYDGSEIVPIAAEPLGTLTSPLRIIKNGNVYGLALVDITDPLASTIRIKTGFGVKALRRLGQNKFGVIIWDVTSNPHLGQDNDKPNDIVADSSGVYIIGEHYITSPSNSQWRIEKRNLNDGSLIWSQVNNPTSSLDFAMTIAVDDTGIYVAGGDSIGGTSNTQWMIEKRDKSTGNIIWTKTVNPSSRSDIITDVSIDNTGIYLIGMDQTLGSSNPQGRIEKRDLSTGNLIWSKTYNPSSGYDVPIDSAVDSTGLYLGWTDNSPGHQAWRMEKRDLSTGNLIWSKNSDPSTIVSRMKGVDVDSTGVYFVGHAYNTLYRKRIEKRDLSTGNIIWEKMDMGVWGSYEDVKSDGNYLYLTGRTNVSDIMMTDDWKWIIEKRDPVTGDLIGVKDYNPSTSTDDASALFLSGNYIFVTGHDYATVSTDFQWRILAMYK